jgi:hypothetical protein
MKDQVGLYRAIVAPKLPAKEHIPGDSDAGCAEMAYFNIGQSREGFELGGIGVTGRQHKDGKPLFGEFFNKI